MLNIQNYTKRFGDKIAVDDLSLHIAAGEICAFIGDAIIKVDTEG